MVQYRCNVSHHTIPSDVASKFTSTPAMSATSTVLSYIASTSKSIPATDHPFSADIQIVSLPVAAGGDISQEEISKSVTVKEFPIQERNLGLWNINDTNRVDYWIVVGPHHVRIMISTFQTHAECIKQLK